MGALARAIALGKSLGIFCGTLSHRKSHVLNKMATAIIRKIQRVGQVRQIKVKICGITMAEQAMAIAQMRSWALGFICVPSSPRYVTPDQIRDIGTHLPNDSTVERIGVFVNADVATIQHSVAIAGLTAVQLHGDESPDFCAQLRHYLPDGMTMIKALRVQDAGAIALAATYTSTVDALLLDAYHPTLLGGTGQTLDWSLLQDFQPPIPWFLAGGLNPDNVLEALGTITPDGIDLSSGVERSPGDKNLDQVAVLFTRLTLHGYHCDR
jgi:phosphoribosylanthranilate isomerase